MNWSRISSNLETRDTIMKEIYLGQGGVTENPIKSRIIYNPFNNEQI